MTRRVNRPYRKTGRQTKEPPGTTAARIHHLAATGHSVIGIARGLNIAHTVLSRWLNTYPDLAEALARGREAEEFALHNVLYRAATKRGNIVAAIYLTKSRHGWIDRPSPAGKDDDHDTPPAPVSVTIDFKDASRRLPKK